MPVKLKNTLKSPAFEVLNADKTGLDFNNKLTPTTDFNLFKYIYFYNGSGVGAGDFNNDGLIDLFFRSNQGQNKLYLNEGGLKFKDVTIQERKFGRIVDGQQVYLSWILTMMVCWISMYAVLGNMKPCIAKINY